MPWPRRTPSGFTLIEVLIVIALVGVLAAIVLPSAQSSMHDQLRATARIIAAELSYARSLAVSNNSTYRVTFDSDGNRLVIRHSGGNSALDTLPASPFQNPDDPPTQHIVDLDELPNVTAPVRLAAAGEYVSAVLAPSNVQSYQYVRPTTSVEFNELGATTSANWTVVWLSSGVDDSSRFAWLSIDPNTGLIERSRTLETEPLELFTD